MRVLILVVVDHGRANWRKGKLVLERPRGANDRVVVEVKGVQIEGYVSLVVGLVDLEVGLRERGRLERVILKAKVFVLVGHYDAVDLRGCIRFPFGRLIRKI